MTTHCYFRNRSMICPLEPGSEFAEINRSLSLASNHRLLSGCGLLGAICKCGCGFRHLCCCGCCLILQSLYRDVGNQLDHSDVTCKECAIVQCKKGVLEWRVQPCNSTTYVAAYMLTSNGMEPIILAPCLVYVILVYVISR